MPKWAVKKGISQEEWNRFVIWMELKLGREFQSQWDDPDAGPHWLDRYREYMEEASPKPTAGVRPEAIGFEPPYPLPPIHNVQPTLELPTTPPQQPSPASARRGEMPEVVQSGGYDWFRKYDLKGNFSHWEVLDRTAEAERTTAEMAATYEEWRRRLLSELTGPRDWITRWQVANKPNPYASALASDVKEAQRQVIEAKGEVDATAAGGIPAAPGQVTDRTITRGAGMPGLAKWMPDLAQRGEGAVGAGMPDLAQRGEEGDSEAVAAKARLEQAFARLEQAQNELLKASSHFSPALPPAPEYLPEFAPGQVTGKTITKERIPNPSLQQLARLPYSEREGLAGFAEFSGQSFSDILDQMAMMAPKTPAGAGRFTFAPTTQRTGMV